MPIAESWVVLTCVVPVSSVENSLLFVRERKVIVKASKLIGRLIGEMIAGFFQSVLLLVCVDKLGWHAWASGFDGWMSVLWVYLLLGVMKSCITSCARD